MQVETGRHATRCDSCPDSDPYTGVMTGLILFAHGARDPRWAEPFERLRQKVEIARPGVPVALAYLDLMAPNLPGAADALVAAGCRALRVVPIFLGRGGHVRKDLADLLTLVAQRHPAVHVDVLPAIGEDDAVLQTMADVCVTGLGA
jgi:sirohydrochlorin cobaltochelatase